MNFSSSTFNIARNAVLTPRVAGIVVTVGRKTAGTIFLVAPLIVVEVVEVVPRITVVVVFGMTFF